MVCISFLSMRSLDLSSGPFCIPIPGSNSWDHISLMATHPSGKCANSIVIFTALQIIKAVFYGTFSGTLFNPREQT